MRGVLVSTGIAVWLSAACAVPACAAAPAAATRVQVLALAAARMPASDLARWVTRQGAIAFTPSPQFLAQLARVEGRYDTDKRGLAQTLRTMRRAPPTAPSNATIIALLESGGALEHGPTFVFQKDYRAAQADFRRAHQAAPKNPWLRLPLGLVLGERGRQSRSLRQFQLAAGALPESAFARTRLGETLARGGQLGNAVAELRAAVKLDPDSLLARGRLASVLLAQHQAQAALRELRRGLQLEPNSASLHNSVGVVLFESGDIKGGLSELRKAVALGSRDPGLFTDLSTVLTQAGHGKAAAAALRQGLQRDPGSLRLGYANCEALINSKQMGQAEVALRQLLSRYPGFAQAHSELGYVLRKSHHVHAAISEYRTAIRLMPNFAGAHFDLAVALYLSGQHRASYLEMVKAFELAPANSTVRTGFERVPERYRRLAAPLHEVSRPALPQTATPPSDVLYFLDSQHHLLRPLEEQIPVVGASRRLFGGVQIKLTLVGEHSPVVLPASGRLEFVVRPGGGINLHFVFLRLHSGGGMRRLNHWSKPGENSKREGPLKFETRAQIQNRPRGATLTLVVPYRLVPGEYAFTAASDGGFVAFCFGVRP